MWSDALIAMVATLALMAIALPKMVFDKFAFISHDSALRRISGYNPEEISDYGSSFDWSIAEKFFYLSPKIDRVACAVYILALALAWSLARFEERSFWFIFFFFQIFFGLAFIFVNFVGMRLRRDRHGRLLMGAGSADVMSVEEGLSEGRSWIISSCAGCLFVPLSLVGAGFAAFWIATNLERVFIDAG